MLKSHFETYLSPRFQLQIENEENDRVKSGNLVNGEKRIPIKGYIPRFVGDSNYASSFGYQWNQFKITQIDSKTGLSLSKKRFYDFTKWSPDELRGKRVLEVGCGPGRFTEIILAAGADLVSADYSGAVDVCLENNRCEKLFVFQGDLFNLPLKEKSFDFVFCYGVLQHTPDPLEAFKKLTAFLKPGGKISVDNYINRLLSPYCTPKYIWRPITTRMKPETLLKILRFYIPLYLPIDTFIRRIPKIGPRILALIPIPCWNYLDWNLSKEQRTEWAVLDTFDALSATYDFPLEIKDFKRVCNQMPFKDYEIFYGSNGLVVNAQVSEK